MDNHNIKFEDTVQCCFYPVIPTQLDELCLELNKTVSVLSENYIWHRDKFQISVSVYENDKGVPAHLTSTTCFGDNVEDEWFIVYLVLQITTQYRHLVVTLQDGDGEFLLIEAADFLPQWVNPDTTVNRVFIYQSKIHIIPPEIIKLDTKLEVQDSINLVFNRTEATTANSEIQESIMKKITSYPQKITESHHRALVTLPLDIAVLLTLKPYLISPISLAFCNHDMLDVKCFKNIKFEHCKTVPVLFTKYLYAMLMHSKLPRISNLSINPENKGIRKKEIALGMKLTCGYQILMNKSSNDIYSSKEYNNFIKSLTRNGYFKNNIEGSKDYKELLEKARDYFYNVESPISLHYCKNISDIMATEEFTNLRDTLESMDFVNNINVSDNDEWLNISPDSLNTFLNTHYGKTIVSNTNSASQITSELANFLNKTSDYEGIEYIEKEDSESNKIEFDPDQFSSSIEKMLGLISGRNSEGDNNDWEFSEEDDDFNIEDKVDKELVSKLENYDPNNCDDKNIIKSLVQSIQEEGISGPSSNMLKHISLSEIRLDD